MAKKNGNGSSAAVATVPWPADRVERRPLGDLTPYARNARTHSEDQVGQIIASIREFGWTMPVLCDENGSIIAGHGRVLAAERMKLAEVPVMVAVGWSDEQKRAYVLADNKLTLNGGWDEGVLREELGELADLGFDLALTGFSGDEIDELVGGLTVEDGTFGEKATPEVNATMFQFGEYRLKVDREDYERWLQALRAQVGMSEDVVLNELKSRLGL